MGSFVGEMFPEVSKMVSAPRTGCPDGSSLRNLDDSSTPACSWEGVSSNRAAGTVLDTPSSLCHFGSMEAVATNAPR